MNLAVITMVFNEEVFLPIWLNHYGQRVGYENLFVIDDGSNDNSTGNPAIVNLIRKCHGALDEDDRARMIGYFHGELLQHYDIVIYTDADELIVVDSKDGAPFGPFLTRLGRDVLGLIGFNVVQRVSNEPAIDLAAPLFAQRRFVTFSRSYCKPLIARRPMQWAAGFHTCSADPAYDPRVLMFHLRAMDIGISRARIRTLNAVRLSDNALRKGHDVHFGLKEVEYLDRLFAQYADAFDKAPDDFDAFAATIGNTRDPVQRRRLFEQQHKSMHRIPDRLRNVINLAASNPGQGAPAPMRTNPVFGKKVIDEMFARSIRRIILDDPARDRNSPCPCGSGKRFKHCHE
jgi:hypothetical protein